jgi:chromosome segregation ATPase
MHIKSLVVKGFKSFEGKTEFEFIPGITAIVGPNGSGKSNIVDALSWVMGEQSTHNLRSKNMNDVIFGGTQTKKALGRASVELTIDNSDGSLPIDYLEVSVSRTLYQNGQSKYAINSDEVRLGDVQDLLSDSSLGKAMHNIIGQGKLDSILNATPLERRMLIEEASGILKYKTKKEKTLRKLNSEEINLNRIEDIIFELKRQMAPLSRQAKQAKVAFEVKENFLDAKKRLLADDISQLAKQKDEYSKKIAELTKKIGVIETEIEALVKQGNDIKQSLSQNNPKLKELTKSYYELNTLREKFVSLGSLATNKLNLLKSGNYQVKTDNYNKLVSEKNTLQSSIASLKSKIDTLKYTIDSKSDGTDLIEFVLKTAGTTPGAGKSGPATGNNGIVPITGTLTIKKEYSKALEPVLSRIYIGDTDVKAKAFAEKNPELIVISNESGKIFSNVSGDNNFSIIDEQIVEEYESSKKELTKLEKSLKDLSSKIDSFEKKSQVENEANIKTVSNVLGKINKHLEHIDNDLTNLTAEQKELEVEIIKHDKTLNTISEKISKTTNDLEHAKDKLHNLELTNNSYIINYENLSNNSVEEFQLPADELIKKYGPDKVITTLDDNGEKVKLKYNREEQTERMNKYSKRYAQLGKINPLAMEEFDRLTERYNFLNKELDDLKSSKSKLLEIIKEMDDKVKSNFESSFEDCRAQFEKIFPRLFPGGKGTIELENPDDILTSGVLVLAQPQGKKLKSMNLLSGGERSLCSLALMIAIFISRPSPFYVLDEVEAALDEINLLRLLEVFKDLRSVSQLLIITHQKQTMSIADAIYGVSMSRAGTSQVITKKL